MKSLARYPEYRPSGLKWLEEIPSHWDVKAARRDFDIQLGKMLQPTPNGPNDSENPYFKAQHVNWEAVQTTGLPFMWAQPGDEVQYGVRNGDLLVCEGGEVGRAGVVLNPPDRAIIQNALHRVRSLGTSDIRLLMYLLQHIASQGWFDVLCNRATIAHFTSEKFGDLPIPVPPLSEQRAIAAFLDRETAKIDALVAKKERLIELLQEKRAALISHAVTRGLPADVAAQAGLDPDVPSKDSGIEWLGEVPAHWEIVPVYVRYEVALGKMLDLKRIRGDWLGKYIRNIDVQWDSVNTRDLPQMDFGPVERDRYRLELGDLLVCEGGEVGRTAVWQGALEECFYQKAIHRVRPRSQRDVPRFFYYVMYSLAKRGVFVAGSNPNTINHLTAIQLSHYRLIFPPSDEQHAIANFLDREIAKIDALSDKVREAIDRLNELRQALISAAVTGKIDVREAPARVPDKSGTSTEDGSVMPGASGGMGRRDETRRNDL